MGAKKNFVLDTNVILHDYKCIENFQENDIYLPIVVLEELDKFKREATKLIITPVSLYANWIYLQATTFFLKELLWVRVKEHSISLQATNIKRKLPCRFRKNTRPPNPVQHFIHCGEESQSTYHSRYQGCEPAYERAFVRD